MPSVQNASIQVAITLANLATHAASDATTIMQQACPQHHIPLQTRVLAKQPRLQTLSLGTCYWLHAVASMYFQVVDWLCTTAHLTSVAFLLYASQGFDHEPTQ